MDIGLHGVKKIRVEKTLLLAVGGWHSREISIVTRKGEVKLTLFADQADKLEIVQVDDLYAPEPVS